MTKSFDSEVKVGELRIFADLERPVVALIAEDRGAFGFRVIPVSDFTSVSCEGEQLVGDRVYQHWNACDVPRSFASRSWLVATLPSSELESLHHSTLHTPRSSLELTPYQRTYIFSPPSPLARFGGGISRRNSSLFTLASSFRTAAGFAIAACAVIALVFAVRFDLDRATHREERAHAWNLVLTPGEPEALQAADEPAESESAEIAGVAPKFVIAPPVDAQMTREPEIGGKVTVPTMAKSSPRSAAGDALDKVDVAVMRNLPRNTVDEHAIAVMTYLACGVNANEKEFGGRLVESTERLVGYVDAEGSGREYTRRLVAVALCRAYAATSNPDLKVRAESALDSLGDRRAVEVVARGYDLIEDWYSSDVGSYASASDAVAVPKASYPDWLRFLQSRSR